MAKLVYLLKKQQVKFTYLSGPLLGKLFSQVTTDASTSAGDQNHLLCQVFPTAWQQRRQTCPDYVVQNLNREKKHTTRAPELHLTILNVCCCKFTTGSPRSGRKSAWPAPAQVYPHANSVIRSHTNCCMSNPRPGKKSSVT